MQKHSNHSSPSSAGQTLWSIVLAAGQGERLAPLVQLLYGRPLPKQFAVLDGKRSLLQATLDSSVHLAPAERTIVVIPERHEDLAREQLEDKPGVHLASQPLNAGTGPGILLPLAMLMERSPHARVVILPSDHHFTSPARFRSRVSDAVGAAARSECGVCLVGAQADAPATDLGWIVADDVAASLGKGTGIDRFVEKPGIEQARQLLAAGAVWNTFVMVGTAWAFWRLAERHMPVQTAMFTALMDKPGALCDTTALRAMYERMPAANFSSDVLTHASGLGLITATGTGWTDLGTPERAMAAMPFVARSRAFSPDLLAASPAMAGFR